MTHFVHLTNADKNADNFRYSTFGPVHLNVFVSDDIFFCFSILYEGRKVTLSVINRLWQEQVVSEAISATDITAVKTFRLPGIIRSGVCSLGLFTSFTHDNKLWPSSPGKVPTCHELAGFLVSTKMLNMTHWGSFEPPAVIAAILATKTTAANYSHNSPVSKLTGRLSNDVDSAAPTLPPLSSGSFS